MLIRRKGFASYCFAVSEDLSSNIRTMIPGDHPSTSNIVYRDAFVNIHFIGVFEFVF